MKTTVITALKMGLCLLLSIIVGCVLMILVYLIPTQRINEHAASSSHFFEEGGDYPYFNDIPGLLGVRDAYTDALMIMTAAYTDESDPVSAAMYNYRYESSKTPLVYAMSEHYLRGQEMDLLLSYERYWHGYLVFLKPMMLVVDYGGWKIVNSVFQAFLSFFVLFLMYKRGLKSYIIPCYNEEVTISQVIRDLKEYLPDAQIVVYNNNSTDRTEEYALKSGADVRRVPAQGKGNVIKQILDDFDGDVLIVLDGDATYPAKYAPELVKAVLGGADMAIGDRLSGGNRQQNTRLFHNFGNYLVRFLINVLFHSKVTDVMTGYRAFDRNTAKALRLRYGGFETETEMTVEVLRLHGNIVSVPIEYLDRPEGSFSKLNTVRDGIRVISAVLSLRFFPKDT